jgi:ATP-binding cassette subfamily C protein LapB
MSNEETVTKPTDWDLGGDTNTHDDPLLDCLELLAKIHNRSVSRNGLRAGLPLVNDCLTVELFSRAADRADLSSRVLKRSLKKISNLELPAVLLLEDRKACVVVAINHESGVVTLLQPESGQGKKKVLIKVLAKVYSGYAIFVRPKYKDSNHQNGEEKVGNSKKWFWGTIFKSWRIYRDVFVASFLINVFGLATPCFILNVYDRVIPNAAIETLWVLAAGIGVIYLFELLMRGLRGYFVDEAGRKANLEISATLFEKVFGLRMEVRPKSVGAFTKNLQQFESIRDFFTSFSITALIDLPFVAVGLFAIWYIAGNMVWIQLGCIVLLLLYAFIIQIPLKKAVEKTFSASAQKNAILVEGLSGMETIKILGAESYVQRAWEESVDFIATWSARSRFLSSTVTHLATFIQSAAVVVVIIVGVYMIAAGQLSQGGLIACVILSRRAIAPMSQVVNLATRFHRARLSLKNLNKIMALPSERPPGKNFLHRTKFRGEIELKNISFTYPEQANSTLKDINLHISHGEKIGMIGPIGSGKTTLGKLILGLYEPISGMVAMDGTDIRQIDPAELRRYIGYVPQDTTLFRGTVRSNIVLGTHDVDDSQVIRAAEISGVSEFVQKNSMGFDMVIGEQGLGLSGGQRQAVSLARAILLDPPILVLDEPTSSMDNSTESKIKKSIDSILEDKTLIIITHRLSLLDLVDRIVVVDNGAIIADGTKTRILEALQSGQLHI